MLLDRYEQQALLFNSNFSEKASEAGRAAYRGELVIIEGEIGDAQGRRKPSLAVMRHAVLLTKDDKLAMVVGCLDSLALLEPLLAKYGQDLAPDARVLLYVVDITQAMQVEAHGVPIVLIPLTNGVAWNELMDELVLEKGDFKGQSAADKVVTAWKAFADYRPKYPRLGMAEAMDHTADIKREAFGAV
jgi:hypothetical protein